METAKTRYRKEAINEKKTVNIVNLSIDQKKAVSGSGKYCFRKFVIIFPITLLNLVVISTSLLGLTVLKM